MEARRSLCVLTTPRGTSNSAMPPCCGLIREIVPEKMIPGRYQRMIQRMIRLFHLGKAQSAVRDIRTRGESSCTSRMEVHGHRIITSRHMDVGTWMVTNDE